MIRQKVVVFVLCGLLPLSAQVVLRASDTSEAGRADFLRALADYDKALTLRESHPDRARALFRGAAQRLESLAASGIVNGRLEYNLGNCYLQASDVGLAVLHYRRAKRLIPRDDRLAENLKEARSRCLTHIKPSAQSAFMKTLFFWHFDTSTYERGRVAIILYVAVWLLLIVYAFRKRRSLLLAALSCAVIGLISTGSLATNLWLDRHNPSGVVVSLDVTTYKGPGRSYPKQFQQPLQPGVEFTRIERRGNWWRIKLADGQRGWIDGTEAALVPAQAGLQLAP